jgi:cytochrome c oxidase subunit 3
MANVSESVEATIPHHEEGGDDYGHDGTGHAGADGAGGHPEFLQHHFDTPAQQFEASKLGMWVFIATEILMFGGLFVAYGIYRGLDAQVFHEAHHQLNKIMGATNTVVLLFSSLTAALAVHSAQVGKRNQTSIYLVITILCACVFLVVKYFEYTHKMQDGLLPGHCFGHPWFGDHCVRWSTSEVQPPPLPVEDLPPRANMFFGLYFVMTGLHGLHVVIGMSILIWVLVKNVKGKFSPEYFTPVDLGALYWHLVDLVWIYLFPLLYLVG